MAKAIKAEKADKKLKVKKMNVTSSQIKELYPVLFMFSVLILICFLAYKYVFSSNAQFNVRDLSSLKEQISSSFTNIEKLSIETVKVDNDSKIYTELMEKEKKRLADLDLDRTNTKDVDSFIRYLELQAKTAGVALVNTKIEYVQPQQPQAQQPQTQETTTPTVEPKISVTVDASDYKKLTTYFSTIYTKEIYYINNFNMINMFDKIRVTFDVTFTPVVATTDANNQNGQPQQINPAQAIQNDGNATQPTQDTQQPTQNNQQNNQQPTQQANQTPQTK